MVKPQTLPQGEEPKHTQAVTNNDNKPKTVLTFKKTCIQHFQVKTVIYKYFVGSFSLYTPFHSVLLKCDMLQKLLSKL